MSGDIFADLLKGSGSGSGVGSADNNDSNLSLKQRMDSTRGTPGTQHSGGLDLDFLDTYVSKKPAASSTASSVMDDLLFAPAGRASSGSNPSLSVNGNVQQNSRAESLGGSSNAGTELLDDFFGQPVPKPTPAASAAVDQAPLAASSATPARPSSQERRDGALAELMDMGFPLEKANAALDSTRSGSDLDGAISYLMEQAHSQTATRQQRPTPDSRSGRRAHRLDSSAQAPSNGDDFGSVVNELSSEFMSTASFLFNTGKKKIQEGVDMYRQQRLENNDGQPLWMKNQLKYKANSMKVPSFTDEDEQEMDPETMRQLIQQQRLREQRAKQERQRQERKDTGSFSSSPLPSRPRTSSSSSSSSSSRTHTPQPARASSRTDNFEMYKSSSRHRPSRTNTNTSSTAPASKSSAADIPSLIETSTIPAPTAFAAAATSTSKFTIPQLDSAQTMSFTTHREIGQEKFKAGDYTASLENFLSASTVIPADHPYQIIISSNLSVVYSKLGNPKEQLAIASRGLKLISQSTGDLPVSELSSINIEDNKTLKNFWVKLMTKRAESLEFLEKWEDAKTAYEKLIKEGESSKAVMDGKNRCVKILNPQAPLKPRAKPRAPPRQQTSDTASAQNGENLKHVKENNLKKEKEEEEKFGLHDKVESQLDRWRLGNKSNIRALICSLDTILWPELNWQPVKLTDLVLDKKVKIYYMKAVAKTHPDKISNSESVENKMIANGVFITLNEAWETFKESKGM